MANREFTIADEVHYDRRGPIRWIISHVLRYKGYLAIFIVGTILSQVLTAIIPNLIGSAFNEIVRPHPSLSALGGLALQTLGVVALLFFTGPAGVFGSEVIAQRLERDTRDELYLSLLAKSQTYHNRQRVGDIMARATNDVRQLNPMINPGVSLILDSTSALVIPIIFIGFIDWRLLLAPLVFTAFYIVAVRNYTRRLTPVTAAMRRQFGLMNAGLEETITGIEVVKSTGQEEQEQRKFTENASAYRDYYVKNGEIQARYLPLLLIAIAIVGGFLQALWLFGHGQISLGQLIAFMGLMALLRYPSFISIFTYSLVQLGIAGANRILSVMREETDLDENTAGYSAEMRGEISFEGVSFAYAQGGPWALRDVSLHVAPGQTVAIVGQTGSGKTTLTKLVNRTYEVTEGRVLLDGVDVREWSLDSLRSQIGAIEQDIFLFSRSVADNIAFGLGEHVTRERIIEAAKQAQAHDFIMGFEHGYDTVVGERGVTLSGGQRQRLAIARALLVNPRILVLDDATSAIDSATEDAIQQALRAVMKDRTTLLITPRLSQIRWADQVVMLRRGQVVAVGSHEELLKNSDLYRRIFSHYDSARPDAVTATVE
ncbi:MAG TPA: ABC transporter ATP-binding protein [Ktedonobacterales bacterium]|jgi:ATP-binding cassette subfamily B protein|nr:ABC transporter ATP-binding protein [Ktedonobacterales bacterium]